MQASEQKNVLEATALKDTNKTWTDADCIVGLSAEIFRKHVSGIFEDYTACNDDTGKVTKIRTCFPM